jgi:hypothetical protein
MNIIVICDDDQNTPHAKKNRTRYLSPFLYTHTHTQSIHRREERWTPGEKILKQKKETVDVKVVAGTWVRSKKPFGGVRVVIRFAKWLPNGSHSKKSLFSHGRMAHSVGDLFFFVFVSSLYSLSFSSTYAHFFLFKSIRRYFLEINISTTVPKVWRLTLKNVKTSRKVKGSKKWYRMASSYF